MSNAAVSSRPPERRKRRRKKSATPKADWAHFDAMTEEEVLAAARADPDALPVEDYPPGRFGAAAARAAGARHSL